MAEIEFLLLDQTADADLCMKRKCRSKMVYRQEETWHGFSLLLYRMHPEWQQKPQRIREYVEKTADSGIALWTDRRLDSCLSGIRQPIPSPGLASFLLKSQPFRQILILHRGKLPWRYQRYWQEAFLEDVYRDLNGLYLLGDDAVDDFFLDRIYEDSGLLATVIEQIPPVDGRKCVFVDLCGTEAVEYRKIPEGSLYLDLTSDREKQRCIAMKRTDISYISARNYLDTALKARYNAF